MDRRAKLRIRPLAILAATVALAGCIDVPAPEVASPGAVDGAPPPDDVADHSAPAPAPDPAPDPTPEPDSHPELDAGALDAQRIEADAMPLDRGQPEPADSELMIADSGPLDEAVPDGGSPDMRSPILTPCLSTVIQPRPQGAPCLRLRAGPDTGVERASAGMITLSDGRAALVGGLGYDGERQPSWLSNVQFYAPEADVWVQGPSLSTARGYPGLVEYQGPRDAEPSVYAVGGTVGVSTANWQATPLVERLPLGGDSWLDGRAMGSPRAYHGVVVADDSILAAGGIAGSDVRGAYDTSERFDGAAWHDGGDLADGRERHAMVALSDGRVLAAGGAGSNNTLNDTTEIWSAEEGWQELEGEVPAIGASATALSDGRALLATGVNPSDGANRAVDRTWIYDPDLGGPNGMVEEERRLAYTRANATLTPIGDPADGWYILVGGQPSPANNEPAVTQTAEVFHDATGRWYAFELPAPADGPRAFHAATRLANGQVLVAGGFNWQMREVFLTSSLIFDISPGADEPQNPVPPDGPGAMD